MKNKILGYYYKILGFLAKQYLKKHKPFVIGINGSVGKTSARMIIYQTLYKFINNKKIYTSNKNFNGELGMSLSIFEIEEISANVFGFISVFFKALFRLFFYKNPYDILILEYGIDRPLEMEFLLEIVQPHVGVFTAIDSVHSLQFGDPAAIAKEEKKMIQNTLEFAFLNIDDKDAISLIPNIEIDYLTYQTQGYDSQGDIRFENEVFTYEDQKLLVNFDLKIKEKSLNITTNMLGKAHYGYIGVAIAILDILNYREDKQSIFDKFEDLYLEYRLQAGRLSVFNGIDDSIIFDSTYNASPLSVQKVLNTVHNIKQSVLPDREIWLLLGDMRELGDLTESDHRKIAGYIQPVADRIFLIGDSMNAYLKDELSKIGFDLSLIESFENSIDLGDFVKSELKKSKTKKILIAKGSQNEIFLEEAVKILLQNKEDSNKLTRQTKFWKNKKSKFFGERKES